MTKNKRVKNANIPMAMKKGNKSVPIFSYLTYYLLSYSDYVGT